PGRDSRGETALRDEVLLELLRVDTLYAGAAGLRRVGAEHLGELAVEIDELLGDLLTFLGVGAQEFRLGPPPEDGTQLPPKVPGVVHGHVHALTRLGAVRVAGIACDKHPRKAGG